MISECITVMFLSGGSVDGLSRSSVALFERHTPDVAGVIGQGAVPFVLEPDRARRVRPLAAGRDVTILRF
jgi:hypothetical protein